MFEASQMACRAVPRTACAALRRVGANVMAARIRKGDSIEQMATRCFATPMVIAALEDGDPHVPIGVLASVLYMINKDHELALICHPGGPALDTMREKAQQSLDAFQAAVKEFMEACGKV